MISTCDFDSFQRTRQSLVFYVQLSNMQQESLSNLLTIHRSSIIGLGYGSSD